MKHETQARAAVKAAGLTVAGLADRVGVGHVHLTKVLLGRTYCSQALAERLSEIIDVPAEVIRAGR